MILFDTDHLSVATDHRDPRHQTLRQRMEVSPEPIACTVVTVEEVLRGWMALIHRQSEVQRQVPVYAWLLQFLNFLNDWEVVPLDERAAERFRSLRRKGIRIGTMDLKIATVALVNNALLVSANTRDFALVPDLRCENSPLPSLLTWAAGISQLIISLPRTGPSKGFSPARNWRSPKLRGRRRLANTSLTPWWSYRSVTSIRTV
jgi:tRNA(fMet)-specific endonuclease VapC